MLMQDSFHKPSRRQEHTLSRAISKFSHGYAARSLAIVAESHAGLHSLIALRLSCVCVYSSNALSTAHMFAASLEALRPIFFRISINCEIDVTIAHSTMIQSEVSTKKIALC
jgi:hypothetical protein